MRATAVLLCLLLAGCASAPIESASETDSPLAFRSIDGSIQRINLAQVPGAPSLHPVGVRLTEPSMGVTSDGTLFTIASENVLRSQDDGASWEQVHSYAVAEGMPVFDGVPPTLDPWLWVDPVTDRIYADHLTIACTTLTWSDDGGDTWAPEWPLACGLPMNDFQKLVTGPPGPEPNPRVGAYPSVAYMCYNKYVYVPAGPLITSRFVAACATSYDGGRVWENEQMLGDNTVVAGVTVVEGCLGGAWPSVSRDGTVIVSAFPDCLYRSRDSGATWERIETEPAGFWAQVFAFDDAGTLYALRWETPLSISVSRDVGKTWEPPFVVQPPGVHAPYFPTLVAGAAGKLFLPMWGTSDPIETAQEATNDTRWDIWLLAIEGADTDAPTTLAHRVTTDDAPIHIGPAVRGTGQYFLGDFVTAAIGPDGTPYVAYPATCNEGCAGKSGATVEDLVPEGTVVALRGWPMR